MGVLNQAGVDCLEEGWRRRLLDARDGTELGEKGIRVNAVAPGVVPAPLTPQTPAVLPGPGLRAGDPDIHALGRWAQPREVANAILFLADEANGFITGVILTVDGGWTIGKKM